MNWILYGLPDDLAIFCFAEVSFTPQMCFKEIEKVCAEEWQYYRRKHNLDETWIYCFCRDKFEQICDPSSPSRCWKLIQGLPPRNSKREGMAFEVLGKKVYLLGGCGWSEDATDEVCYDASMNTWE
ncbi:hypothetical protein L1049_018509 [Liquidambar formosana]|uniref:F-box/kelch-repeat protein n=1 Tax=Liquidambar formosana TaxID=63359 RepID=A0AAP0WMC3_LIQFO